MISYISSCSRRMLIAIETSQLFRCDMTVLKNVINNRSWSLTCHRI